MTTIATPTTPTSFAIQFSLKEIKEVIWSCEGKKLPGPDGFNLGFFKSCWVVIKADLEKFVYEFYIHPVLPKVVTAFFIVLIPKINNHQSLDDYRPICLIGSAYCILAKLLASRLKKVMFKLIYSGPSAFLPKRYMMDGGLIIN
ncbi:uncharacterized protein LOC131604104 [Vicia villosa]|uniref:uncharacterized protein LOC131604104 n=1 Tax=Vicia villosa TaxID=3911 RepID=UPI00273BE39E|nr:uncharacterized protein LOC131604104 [Vicia villosa]